jgi:uncharacterized protein (TIGR00369 family)
MTAVGVPEGFSDSGRSSAFLDLIGPVYERGTGPDYQMAFQVDARHANTHGGCHGGVIASILDVYVGRLAMLHTPPPTPGVTVQLAIDYLGAIPVGAWVIAHGQVDKKGRELAHVSGTLTVDGRAAARATAIFRILKQG